MFRPSIFWAQRTEDGMATKPVHVDWKSGGSSDYTGVARIEEDRSYEHVVGWRLYDEKGELIVKFSNDIVSYMETHG
jgi:hypothetical protein